MKQEPYPFIIIGAGITGVTAADTLTQNSNQAVLLLHNEDRAPYKRTQINKHIASGFETNQFTIHPNDWYRSRGIIIMNQNVVSIDPDKRLVLLQSGEHLHYQSLLIATGSKRRSLGNKQWDDLAHRVGRAMDVEKLMDTLPKNSHYTILGAGVEGLETAFQLRKKGKQVLLLDRNPYPAGYLFSSSIQAILLKLLHHNGIEFLGDSEILQIKQGKKKLMITTNLQQITTDILVACNGSMPRTELAINAGIACNKGILTDSQYRTNKPGIFAAGDVAEHENNWCTNLWHAAEKQGHEAALQMLQNPVAYRHEPFRTKMELGDHFFFSGGYFFPQILPVRKIKFTHPFRHREIYLREDNTVQAILSVNEGNFAKGFQLALFEKWSLHQVLSNFPFDT